MEEHIVAAVLAGGLSRRFGADKAMAELGGVPMLVRVGERLRPQAEGLAVVGHAAGAAMLGGADLSDPPLPAKGPLLGVLSGLEWAGRMGAAWLISAPCDAPFIPLDMGRRLIAAARAAGASAAFAATRGGLHPLCAAWSPVLAPALRTSLAGAFHPAVRDVAPGAPSVLFEDESAFANINTPDDFARLGDKIAKG